MVGCGLSGNAVIAAVAGGSSFQAAVALTPKLNQIPVFGMYVCMHVCMYIVGDHDVDASTIWLFTRSQCATHT